jgi:hypothetical protein
MFGTHGMQFECVSWHWLVHATPSPPCYDAALDELSTTLVFSSCMAERDNIFDVFHDALIRVREECVP